MPEDIRHMMILLYFRTRMWLCRRGAYEYVQERTITVKQTVKQKSGFLSAYIVVVVVVVVVVVRKTFNLDHDSSLT